MGTNNRSRRAAKARKKRQKAARQTHRRVERDPIDLTGLTDADLIMTGVHAARVGDDDLVGMLVDRLGRRPDRRVAAQLAKMLELQVAWLWTGGWQPADLARVVAARLGNPEVDLLREAIEADADGYALHGRSVAPGWMAQLEAIGVVCGRERDLAWPLRLDEGWRRTLAAGFRLLDLLGTVPELPVLTPPPAKWVDLPMAVSSPGGLDPTILARVRGLLAKAESTAFDAEAEAFTAKAQELMTRHRLDRATVERGGRRTMPAAHGRRVGIEDPYAEAKAILLAGIAEANGCRVVWSKELGFSTMFGLVEELDYVEELFTSLMVQASAALRREGSKRDTRGRSRTTRFRRSFLVSFGGRVGERLATTTEETMRTVGVESGADLAPVLVERARAADEAVESTFPDMVQHSVSATDAEGYWAGRRLGDEVELGLVAASVGAGRP